MQQNPHRSHLRPSRYHEVILWEASSGRRVLALSTPISDDKYGTASFSPDGTRIVTIQQHADFRSNVWSTTSGKLLGTIFGQAAFSPRGRYIVSAHWNNNVFVWDASTLQQLTTLEGHSNFVRSAAFSSDGERFVTASDDGTARVWILSNPR